MEIAVLALQGAFIEHEKMLHRLGATSFEIRQRADWNRPKDGIIIPGGESTTMTKLLHELQLFQPVQEAIKEGLPVFGTCAGLILLAKEEAGKNTAPHLATMDMEVCRNAYGRQLGSFYTESDVEGLENKIPMTFIRAPYIKRLWGDAQCLATVGGHIVAARQGNQLVTAFHPELNEDVSLHRYFLDIVNNHKNTKKSVSLRLNS